MGHGVDTLTRMVVTLVYGGQNCLLTYWLRGKPTSPSANFKADTDGAVSEFKVTIWPKLQALMTNEVQMVGAVATMLSPLNAAQTVANYAADFGSVVGEGLPPHDAMLLSLFTAYPGRRTHGRQYIPGVPESVHQQGILANTHVAKLALYGDILINHWGEGGTSSRFWGGVYSRKNGNSISPGPPPFVVYNPLYHIPWTRYLARATVKTCRNRQVGRGI